MVSRFSCKHSKEHIFGMESRRHADLSAKFVGSRSRDSVLDKARTNSGTSLIAHLNGDQGKILCYQWCSSRFEINSMNQGVAKSHGRRGDHQKFFHSYWSCRCVRCNTLRHVAIHCNTLQHLVALCCSLCHFLFRLNHVTTSSTAPWKIKLKMQKFGKDPFLWGKSPVYCTIIIGRKLYSSAVHVIQIILGGLKVTLYRSMRGITHTSHGRFKFTNAPQRMYQKVMSSSRIRHVTQMHEHKTKPTLHVIFSPKRCHYVHRWWCLLLYSLLEK